LSYRDDAAAILARANALARELAAARREIAALKGEAPPEAEPLGLELVARDEVAEARQSLERLIGELDVDDDREPEAPGGEEARAAAVAALRRALLALLSRRLDEVPRSVIAAIDACQTPEGLIDWIAAAGAARTRRGILDLFA
jgi:hypothetical protein